MTDVQMKSDGFRPGLDRCCAGALAIADLSCSSIWSLDVCRSGFPPHRDERIELSVASSAEFPLAADDHI